VTVGVTDGDDVSIERGLVVGEQVVVEGAERLRDGSAIELRKVLVNYRARSSCGRSPRRCSWPRCWLAGALAYRLLPVSALPQVDLPEPSRSSPSTRGEPGRHGVVGHRPLERFLGQMPGLNQMTSHQLERQLGGSRCSSP